MMHCLLMVYYARGFLCRNKHVTFILPGMEQTKNEQRTAQNKGLKSEESADDYLRVAYRKLLLNNNPKYNCKGF